MLPTFSHVIRSILLEIDEIIIDHALSYIRRYCFCKFSCLLDVWMLIDFTPPLTDCRLMSSYHPLLPVSDWSAQTNIPVNKKVTDINRNKVRINWPGECSEEKVIFYANVCSRLAPIIPKGLFWIRLSYIAPI